jgi:diguanylate cyclase (GGDEF)-like protein
MVATAMRGRREQAAPPRAIVPAQLAEFERARQDFLDGLPLAAAILRLRSGGACELQVSNVRYAALDAPADGGSLIARGGLPARLAVFLASGAAEEEFELRDGPALASRVYAVRFTRLSTLAALGPRALVTLLDRTAEVETEKSLRAEMIRDSLTGLPNRSAFNAAVEAVLEEPSFLPGSYAVLVLDIARFSRVNECVGALAGDELLIAFARRLVSALRAHDLLARTGGDEFAVLMRLERGLDDALQAADRIRAALAAPFRLSELEIRVDCAMGCALLGGSESLAEEVLRNAQFALKRAKRSGEVQIYEPNQARAARRRFSIETELRRAIEAAELRLAFQPIVCLATGAVTAFEALARWDHPERGAISPDEFIPVAEESGLIVPLGRWALACALETLAGWDKAAGRPLPIRMSVNLSAIQVARDAVPEMVAAMLAEHGLGGERLTLELTESAIVHDPERATEVLGALKALGVRVAMDDFGTGYTSLAYLQRLPIDVLKIDRSFVSGMLGDADSTAIVRAILSLAEALGLQTTAEGIDSPGLVTALAAMGCSRGQGFHFAQALPADAAFDYWRSRSA